MAGKKILGLDIGVNSVGFALITKTKSDVAINHLGVRIVPSHKGFHDNFEKGQTASKNADRRTKRAIRRGYQRFKLRQKALKNALSKYGMLPDEALMNLEALPLYELRAKAVTHQLSLPEIGRVFYHILHRRGFKSNRKNLNDAEESAYLNAVEENDAQVKGQTIGQYLYSLLKDNPLQPLKGRTFSREKYLEEFNAIWETQAKYYPDLLTGSPNSKRDKNALYTLFKDDILFYQRPLKSAKGLVSRCDLEPSRPVAPITSPLFQYYRAWLQVNNLALRQYDDTTIELSHEQKSYIIDYLGSDSVPKSGKVKISKVLKLLKLSRSTYSNYEELDGIRTLNELKRAFKTVSVSTEVLSLNDLSQQHENSKLYQIWHLIYSAETEQGAINGLQRLTGMTEAQADSITKSVGFSVGYSKTSHRAIKKLLPFLESGFNYSDARQEAGYQYTKPSEQDRVSSLELLPPNSLRNPVVEQILNQTINIVNNMIQTFGPLDEIHVELARDVKKSAKERSDFQSFIRKNTKIREAAKNRILEENIIKNGLVSKKDIDRYLLWEQTDGYCLYSGHKIPLADLYNQKTEIEHVIPRSRSFDDSRSNKIISYRSYNQRKGQMTGMDFMESLGEEKADEYVRRVNDLYQSKKIGKKKRERLLMKSGDIPADFTERQLNDTRYISRKALEILGGVAPDCFAVNGMVTDHLKEQWGLKYLMQEVNLPKYEALGQVSYRTIKDNDGNPKKVLQIENWSKRDDHRHHALDALVVALCSRSIMQKLSTLNQRYESMGLSKSPLTIPAPATNLRQLAKEKLELCLISFKANSKVLSRKINVTKKKNGKKGKQVTWVPRGALHEETVRKGIWLKEEIPAAKALERIDDITSPKLKAALQEVMAEANGQLKKAKSLLKKSPVLHKGKPVEQVKVWHKNYSKRVAVGNLTNAQLGKIQVLDPVLYEALMKEGRQKEDLVPGTNGEPVKSVRVLDNGTYIPLRGGFVTPGNNHHAIIYKDINGKLQEKVVPFWEATAVSLQNVTETGSPGSAVQKPADCAEIQLILKQNHIYCVGMNPKEFDWESGTGLKLLIPHLYRCQKMSSKFYVFRHIHESRTENTFDFAQQTFRNLKDLTAKVYPIKISNIATLI
jgi:CRISPR-associated endonuclease Csn1